MPEGWNRELFFDCCRLCSQSNPGDLFGNHRGTQCGQETETRRSAHGLCCFRQRLLFPVKDAAGCMSGLDRRDLIGRDPKYVNSPTSAVFYKGCTLYALDIQIALDQHQGLRGLFGCHCLAPRRISSSGCTAWNRGHAGSSGLCF